MFQKCKPSELILMVSVVASLVFSEILYFDGSTNITLLTGLWGLSVVVFGVAFYLALQDFKI